MVLVIDCSCFQWIKCASMFFTHPVGAQKAGMFLKFVPAQAIAVVSFKDCKLADT